MNYYLKTILLGLCVGMMIGKTYGQAWKPITASVTFKVKMFGVAVEGSFKGLAGSIQFDPEHLNKASIMASIDTRTLDTDNSLRNKHLREKEEFFNVAKYPSITMKSTKIEKTAEGFVGYFDLTIKSVTKNVKVPFRFTPNGTNATFAGTFTINRREWEVGGGTLGMSNDVSVTILVNTQSIPQQP
ncbi:MAG: YceI family protein [Spirosomataceae bacterium]